MNEAKVTIPVRIDARSFRAFALFDAFHVKRRWISPVVFALILLISAALCLLSRREGSLLLGAVLILLALGLPAVWLGTFLRSIQKQILRLELNQTPPKLFYTVELSDEKEGVAYLGAQSGAGVHRQPWSLVYGAYRVDTAIYLYVSAQRAYLLPNHQASLEPDALWAYIGRRLPGEKLHDLRKKL